MVGIATIFNSAGLAALGQGANIRVQHVSVFLDKVASGTFNINEVVMDKTIILRGGAISDKSANPYTVDLVATDEVLVSQTNNKGKTTISFQVVEFLDAE